MSSLKDVKTKISGVRKTKQITKAMNMVASSKLRGAQARMERFRPYADKFFAVLRDLAGKTDGVGAHPLLDVREEQKAVLFVLATSDRGLCGGFNANLISKALQQAKMAKAAGKEVRFVCVGKKGRDAVRKSGFTLHAEFADELNDFDFSLATRIGKDLITSFTTGLVDEVVLIYGRFESMARQVPTVQPLLPVRAEPSAAKQEDAPASTDYIYEPDVASLLGALLPQFVNVQVFRSLLDTAASENAARMMAMDNATRNCDDLTGALTLLYNKTRQASITSDLIDIVGGAEALK